MKEFGLLGKSLSHSFSKKYFTEKFEKLGLSDHVYHLFELPSIDMFPALVYSHPELIGMNVTLPYKESVIPYLSSLDDSAQAVGAVNVIRFHPENNWVGYNSDYYGFMNSLVRVANEHSIRLSDYKALILGTGGAAKAVEASLKILKVDYAYVSREAGKAKYTYEDLTREVLIAHKLIVNASPLGMYPHVDHCPPIDYDSLGSDHILYDLVYNPENTLFMQKGKERQAIVCNGLKMLYLQAEKAWEIWNT